MTQETIRIGTIKAVSPTLAETFRLCKLRAGLSRAQGSSRHVLGNPKAWLGTAYHAVLEAVDPEDGADIEARVRDRWNAAVEAQYERSRAHPFDRRFGPPESWPGYHMVAALALVRARALVESAGGPSTSAGSGQRVGAALRERKFASSDGKIVGRPDLVRPDEVVDFKSGDVFEDEDQDQIKLAYIRQLRLYGYLVKETAGWWPRRGILLPMAGSPAAVELEPEECEVEAAEAIRLLDAYNEMLYRSVDPIDLASPSPASCRWCPHQLYCPAFWGALSPDWEAGLRTAAFEGIVLEPPSPIHDGTALALVLRAERGTQPESARVHLFPLLRSVHVGIETVQPGDVLRVTGLWRRADGSLVPSLRTLIAEGSSLPCVVVNSWQGSDDAAQAKE
jgi:hypothetical protein